MINIHIKDFMIGTKPSSTNAIGYFQAIANLVSIVSGVLCKFF